MTLRLDAGMSGLEEIHKRLTSMSMSRSKARDNIYTEAFFELGEILKTRLADILLKPQLNWPRAPALELLW